MAYTIEKIDIWSGCVDDKPGALAGKLAPLSLAGANLEFVLARRDAPGMGVVFIAPIKGAALARLAKQAGLNKAGDLVALRVTGANKAGLGAKLTALLAEAEINLRALSGTSVGRQSVLYFAFDTDADAGKARRLIAKSLK